MSTIIGNVIDSIQSPQTTRTPIPSEVMQANAVLGYIAGNSWLTFPIYLKARPDLARLGRVLPVSLTYAAPRGTKRCIYDIEPGGGKNENIGLFAERVDKSELFGLYTFASNGAAMLAQAARFGYHRGKDFFYISAHANGVPHICGPKTCGFPEADMTQYLFAGLYDKSLAHDYCFPLQPAPPPNPLLIHPKNIGDNRYANNGNERLTVMQANGALEQYATNKKYHNYLKGKLHTEIKQYRDRCWRVAKFTPPDYTNLRPRPRWGDKRHFGTRWQHLNSIMVRIDHI